MNIVTDVIINTVPNRYVWRVADSWHTLLQYWISWCLLWSKYAIKNISPISYRIIPPIAIHCKIIMLLGSWWKSLLRVCNIWIMVPKCDQTLYTWSCSVETVTSILLLKVWNNHCAVVGQTWIALLISESVKFYQQINTCVSLHHRMLHIGLVLLIIKAPKEEGWVLK